MHAASLGNNNVVHTHKTSCKTPQTPSKDNDKLDSIIPIRFELPSMGSSRAYSTSASGASFATFFNQFFTNQADLSKPPIVSTPTASEVLTEQNFLIDGPRIESLQDFLMNPNSLNFDLGGPVEQGCNIMTGHSMDIYMQTSTLPLPLCSSKLITDKSNTLLNDYLSSLPPMTSIQKENTALADYHAYGANYQLARGPLPLSYASRIESLDILESTGSTQVDPLSSPFSDERSLLDPLTQNSPISNIGSISPMPVSLDFSHLISDSSTTMHMNTPESESIHQIHDHKDGLVNYASGETCRAISKIASLESSLPCLDSSQTRIEQTNKKKKGSNGSPSTPRKLLSTCPTDLLASKRQKVCNLYIPSMYITIFSIM
jgi:hypothetical protein